MFSLNTLWNTNTVLYQYCSLALCYLIAVQWLDLDKTLREQGIDDTHSLLLKRKFFYSDKNVDIKDPVQLNLLYVQVIDWLPKFNKSRFVSQNLSFKMEIGFVLHYPVYISLIRCFALHHNYGPFSPGIAQVESTVHY